MEISSHNHRLHNVNQRLLYFSRPNRSKPTYYCAVLGFQSHDRRNIPGGGSADEIPVPSVVSMCLVNTTDPGLYAPALAKLKVPYKGAFVVDLAMRYLPVYVEELETTMNAQMARGYKVKVRGGLFARILNTVPLIVPVAMNAMLSIYDVADAMELRAFGAEKTRTWYRTVDFKRSDYASIILLFCNARCCDISKDKIHNILDSDLNEGHLTNFEVQCWTVIVIV